MDQTFTLILLLLSSSAAFGKYVFIAKREIWHEAQRYCREFHTDLAPVSNSHDTERLKQLAVDPEEYIWIGLTRNSTDPEKWTWSGGEAVSTFFWAEDQPNNRLWEDYGIIYNYAWHDATPLYFQPFFCYSVVVVRERKTWEEALHYCREHHRDLASVASDTEMMLIQKELNKNETTAHIWIGLHFFPREWLWVDGQPMSYEAWGQEGKPVCPKIKLECAALKVMDGTNGARRTAPDGQTNSGESDSAADVKVWEAHDCEERLHFICY